MNAKPSYARMLSESLDCADGGRLSDYDIVVSGESGHRKTGITLFQARQSSDSPWIFSVWFGDVEYPSVDAAIAAYEAKAARA